MAVVVGASAAIVVAAAAVAVALAAFAVGAALEAARFAPAEGTTASPDLLLDSVSLVAGLNAILANVSSFLGVFESVAIEAPEKDLAIEWGSSCQSLAAFSLLEGAFHCRMQGIIQIARDVVVPKARPRKAVAVRKGSKTLTRSHVVNAGIDGSEN